MKRFNREVREGATKVAKLLYLNSHLYFFRYLSELRIFFVAFAVKGFYNK